MSNVGDRAYVGLDKELSTVIYNYVTCRDPGQGSRYTAQAPPPQPPPPPPTPLTQPGSHK